MAHASKLSVGGVGISLHWSVLVVCIAIAAAGTREPFALATAVASYFAMILVHEAGHVLMARRFGYHAVAIELYPIHGLTRLPYVAEPFARAMIAWGGILAQLAVAAPLVAWLFVVGFTTVAPVNAILAILGPFSVVIACVNLLPVRPLEEPRRGRCFRSCFMLYVHGPIGSTAPKSVVPTNRCAGFTDVDGRVWLAVAPQI